MGVNMWMKRTLSTALVGMLVSGCGGGGGGSEHTVIKPPEDINYLISLSNDKTANTLMYTKQISKYVDDLEFFGKNFLSQDENKSYFKILEAHQKSTDAFFNADFSSLNADEKEKLLDQYQKAQEELNTVNERLISSVNQLVVDEINVALFTKDDLVSTSSSLRAERPRFLFSAAVVTIGVAAMFKGLLNTMHPANKKVIEAALKTEKGRKFVIGIFRKHDIDINDNASAGEIIGKYDSMGVMGYTTKLEIKREIENAVSEDIMNEDGKFGNESASDLKKANDTYHESAKKAVSKVAETYYGNLCDPLGHIPVVSEIKDGIEIVNNIKDLATNPKPIKTLGVSKAKKSEPIVSTQTELKKAKSIINTLNNKDGLHKVDLKSVGDAYNAITKDLAKKDGDGDDTLLTIPKTVIVQSNSLVKSGSAMEANLTVATKDLNESFDFVSVVDPKNYELNSSGSLPDDLVIDTFEDVKPKDLNTTPMTIVSLDKNSTTLSSEKISEDATSIKYRVTAVVKDIYKNANVYLEIYDGSAVMGTTSRQDINTTATHTQTLTWDVDVLLNSSAVMKLSRSDDVSYSDYISLSGGTPTPVDSIVGTYSGTYTVTVDDEEHCMPKGYTDSVSVSIDANNVVRAQITLGGTVFTDTGIRISSNTIYDDGSGDNLAWSGNIIGNTISGTFQDLEDGCNGTFSVSKN